MVLNFGKHKGKAVVDVLASDPGYFLWLLEAGQAQLDRDVGEVVRKWALSHKSEAAKTVASARKARTTPIEKPPEYKESRREESVSREVSYTVQPTPAHVDNPNWGQW